MWNLFVFLYLFIFVFSFGLCNYYVKLLCFKNSHNEDFGGNTTIKLTSNSLLRKTLTTAILKNTRYSGYLRYLIDY